jgi:4-hydroxybenzoate polyprenyltransferase
MRTFWALIRCSHPEPVVLVTAVCGALALFAGRGWGTVWVVLAVLAGQLFVGWTNDYVDRARDRDAQRADKPLARDELAPAVVRRSAIAAAVAAVVLSLASGVAATAVHLTGIASATAYNLRLKATPLSVVCYAVSFAMVPPFITLGLAHSHWPPLWVTAAASLTGVGGHFAQARPDVERDREQGVLGMPQVAGDRGSAVLAAVFMVAGAAVIAAGAWTPLPLVAVIPAIGVAGAKPALAFWFALVTAGVVAAAFILTAGSALS